MKGPAGKTHPIVAFARKGDDRAPGAVFEISDAELTRADAYEVAAYVRVKTSLASGLEAWVMSTRPAKLRRREPERTGEANTTPGLLRFPRPQR